MSKFTGQVIWFLISAAIGIGVVHFFGESKRPLNYLWMALSLGIASLVAGYFINRSKQKAR